MTQILSPSEPAAPAERPVARLRVADLLLPGAIGMWVLAVSRTRPARLGPWGLLSDLSPAFYLALALLIVSAAIELARRLPSSWRMAAHLVALVVLLYGTAPVVYSQGRYAWLYKTVGVVQYVNAHGALDRHIDIYQNWPGFFALAAWFGKVAGVSNPLAYAKWAQLVFELAALPLLYAAYDALSLTVRQRWAALLFYPAANWIGQDYFSPQALGTLLGLGVMAIALRWLSVGSAHANQEDGAGRPRWRRSAPLAVCCGLLLLIYFVLTFTHELSPYILAVQLGALAVSGLLRPRWLPSVLFAVAVGYLLPRLAFVSARYGLLASIGNFFSNIQPPSHAAIATPLSQRVIQHCAQALSLGMWGLALLGAWLHRRSGPAIRALALLAFSAVVVLAAGGYGNEGILRVYLFSLPWTAALAAVTLAPADAGPGSRSRLSRGTLGVPLAVAVALGLFLPAFFGDDSFNMMPEAQVASVTAFLESAQPGPVYCAVANAAPVADTARYNQFPLMAVFGSGGVAVAAAAGQQIAAVLADQSLRVTHGRTPAYVLVTPTMLAYAQAYGVPPLHGFAVLLASLAHSSRWRLFLHRAGTVVYELPPREPPRGSA